VAEAASPEARRLASHAAFFAAHPVLLPAALAAVRAPALPVQWLRVLAVLDEAEASEQEEEAGPGEDEGEVGEPSSTTG